MMKTAKKFFAWICSLESPSHKRLASLFMLPKE